MLDAPGGKGPRTLDGKAPSWRLVASWSAGRRNASYRALLLPNQGFVYFRSQFATARKSFRAAPPRSEFIETYQPRFFGIGPDSTREI